MPPNVELLQMRSFKESKKKGNTENQSRNKSKHELQERIKLLNIIIFNS